MVRVKFVGEVVIPAPEDFENVVAQDVQNEIGYAGVVVIDIEYVSAVR